MNTDTALKNVKLPIEFTFDEKQQRILIALHHLGWISVNKLRIVSYLLCSSKHDYVKLLKQIIKDEAYGTVDLIENDYNASKLPELFKSAPNFKELPEIDEEIRSLSNIGLIEKYKSITNIKYDSKTKELISIDRKTYRDPKSSVTADYSKTYGKSETFDSVIKIKKFINQSIRLTDNGKRVAQSIAEGRRVIFQPMRSKRTKIFIACALGYDEIDQLYESQLEPSCKEFRYEPFRVDRNEPPQTITESILQGIVEAECVIADLTFARPSVYFEVGLAHGLGIPLVLTCRKDHLNGTEDDKKVHFDLAQYKISYWSVTEQGKFEWEEGMSPAERLKLVLKGEDKP